MQRLEVSGAVRPLKWSLGVKGLSSVFPTENDFPADSSGLQSTRPYHSALTLKELLVASYSIGP